MCKFARRESIIRLVYDKLKVAVGGKRDELVPVVDCSTEHFHAVRPFDALRAHTSEQVQHPVVLFHMLQVCVDLGNKAKGSATFFADELLLRDRRGYPSWLTSDF